MLKLKKFLNENKVAIIIFSILLFIVMYSCFKYIRNDIKVKEGREERTTYCKSDEVKESEKLSCEQYIEAITNEEIKTEFYSMFGDILVFDIHYLNFIAFLSSISIFVAGFGVMNALLSSVSERSKEIAIRRALGAKKSDIYLSYMIEGTFLSIIGISLISLKNKASE